MPVTRGLLQGDEQHNRLRTKTLKAAGCRRIFEEAASGGRWDRPELHRLLDQLREGDTVVVWKLDRLSRTPKDVLYIMERVVNAGAGFRSITENIDTTTPARRMMMQMVGAFAQFEHAMIRERTSAGLAAARAEGRIGRPGGRRPARPAARAARQRRRAVAATAARSAGQRFRCRSSFHSHWISNADPAWYCAENLPDGSSRTGPPSRLRRSAPGPWHRHGLRRKILGWHAICHGRWRPAPICSRNGRVMPARPRRARMSYRSDRDFAYNHRAFLKMGKHPWPRLTLLRHIPAGRLPIGRRRLPRRLHSPGLPPGRAISAPPSAPASATA
ncbi:hypothetical protein CCS01_18705 [Rhodopila globiformis]|uniref:Resolvase/invertase-type recombinase catalytic domain-containing protein n=1 Tax=Rhodopila globiformis TaxID=1071 RepID=A0A2S6N7R6_RHOGL|nr:hypothetical protein CCS01_18705 [Rhodopila globiformis]